MKELDLNIFPATSKSDWMQLAENQLKGADPSTELAWKNVANIELNAYYDETDISALSYLEDFFLRLDSHKWKLYEEIEGNDSHAANDQAIKALMGGCDGVIFKNPKNLEKVLKNIDTQICDISIITDEERSVDSRFTGFELHNNGSCIASEEDRNPIEQIYQLLNTVTNETHVYRKAMADFFLEIATVRSLRYLMELNGHNNIKIHTKVPLHPSSEHQWFLNTTAGLASILGGSHSIDLSTATGDSRISRNTGNLIREESGIDEYNDQCGGSYYVEVLTDKIIKKVSEKLKL